MLDINKNNDVRHPWVKPDGPILGLSMRHGISRDYYALPAWLLQNLIYPVARFYLKTIRRIRISRDVAIDKLSKPLMVAAAPHLTHLDVVVIPAALPRHYLPVRWLADRKIFNNPAISLWLKLWGAIPVSRDQDGRFQSEDIDRILGLAVQGNCIGIFPECCLVGKQFGKQHQHIICHAIQQQIKVIPASLHNLTVGGGSVAVSKQVSQIPVTKPHVIISKPLESCLDLLDALAR